MNVAAASAPWADSASTALAAASFFVFAISPVFAQTTSRIAPSVIGPNTTARSAEMKAVPSPSQAGTAPNTITPFVLKSVDISGSTLSAAVLQSAYAPFLGQTIDQVKLNQITNAIAATYAKSDVALYTVLAPNQRFDAGGLKLRIVEGYIESVAIEGALDAKQRDLVMRYIKPLRAQRPLQTHCLQRYVSFIRDIPGLYADLSFDRGGHEGAVKLIVKASARSLQVAFGLNNRGTALLGRTQGQMDVFANDLVKAGDQLKGTIILPTDPRLFQYYAFAYTAPLSADGAGVGLTLGYLRTRPSEIPIAGSATSFGLQFTQQMVRSYTQSLYVVGSLDGVNSDNALIGQTLSSDRTRAARLAISYSRTQAKNYFTASAIGSIGLSSLGARTLQPESVTLDFKKLTGKIGDNIQLSRNLILRLNGFGQITSDRLPAAEQVALGGDEFGRGYEAAVISGDYGVASSVELAYRPVKRLAKPLLGSEAYIFVDGGKVWSYGRFGGSSVTAQLASIGGGVRAAMLKRSLVQIELVRGLYNPVFYENREVWRALFSIRTTF